MDVLKALDEIKRHDDHYLVRARQMEHSYFDGFLRTAEIMGAVMTQKVYRNWLRDKMLVRPQRFDEMTFIQFAVEAAVIRYFWEKRPDGFQVEAKIRPGSRKDVDCRFKSNGFFYNVEVKCADFTAKRETNGKQGIQIATIGRLPGHRETIEKLTRLMDGMMFQSEELNERHELKNMDNTMKEFLESAQGKFNPNASENEVNVLVVACDDAEDVQHWYYYLYAGQGLFTDHPFADSSLYDNVDLVVFTNLFFRQYRFFEKRIGESWSVGNAFNLVFPNPLKRALKLEATLHFLDLLDHYSFQLQDYQMPGDIPDHVKSSRRIVTFIKAHLEKEKGIYLFEQPEKLRDLESNNG